MLYGALGVQATARIRPTMSRTGKRKEQVLLLEEGEEESFADSQEIIMEIEEQDKLHAMSNEIKGTGNQTNRQLDKHETTNPRLK
jgi:hypothetical protein